MKFLCRAYQVCIAGEDAVCTELFSLEMNIPFVNSSRDEVTGDDDLKDKIGDKKGNGEEKRHVVYKNHVVSKRNFQSNN